jgi:hypothetical protein
MVIHPSVHYLAVQDVISIQYQHKESMASVAAPYLMLPIYASWDYVSIIQGCSSSYWDKGFWCPQY